ncbi:hypothetical protein KL864_34025 [Mycolicibacterium goodii]|uniref:hypothetical protein n=1 Tax=Mycolicibacterium goodii TaxID=134601 RepID=UPI001BDD20AB|nr:hypothetical protein [Mycolicibacterium goodii]MBU8820886.1 hypothetical protein [Mycolicibacterium goodii]
MSFEPGERWIPADRRWLGLDRRTVAPALAVVALVVVMDGVLPAVNDGVGYHDEVAAGDVIAIDGGVTFVPEPGWGITSGVRLGDAPADGTYPDTATVVRGDISLTVHTDTFHGDVDELLTQIAEEDSDGDGDPPRHDRADAPPHMCSPRPRPSPDPEAPNPPKSSSPAPRSTGSATTNPPDGETVDRLLALAVLKCDVPDPTLK